MKVSADLLGDLGVGIDSDMLPNLMGGQEAEHGGVADSGLAAQLVESIERLPSPPPLPMEWDLGDPSDHHMSQGMLFDFAQFDQGARRQSSLGHEDRLKPHTTAITAMNPLNMSNPSDDYIWQILFANPSDEVPKRVTAHLHNPATHNDQLDTLKDIADYDPILAGLNVPALTGDPSAPEDGKKTVTVTYEVGEDGKYQVKHVANHQAPEG